MKNLKDSVALITGGAMGMGFAIAEKLLEEGVRAIITDINGAQLSKAVETLSEKGEIHGYVSDVSNLNEIKSLKEKVNSEVGKVDILVNNAGIVFGGFFDELDIERIEKIIRVDLLGLIYMTRIFIGDMLESGRGHIVNIASAAGLVGVPKLVPYCAAKFGVVGFSESLRLELQLKGYEDVKVTAICPSYVSTGMFDGARPPKFTKFVSPDTMAKIIVEAIKKDQYCVLVPGMVKLIPFLKTFLPPSMIDRLSFMLGVSTSMNRWKGRDGGKDNQ